MDAQRFFVLALLIITSIAIASEGSCRDSDGNDILNPGKVTWIFYGGDQEADIMQFSDSCPDTARVIEYFCPSESAGPAANVVSCPEGHRCSDGSCVPGPEGIADPYSLLYGLTQLDSDSGPQGIYTRGYSAEIGDSASTFHFDYCEDGLLMEQTYGRAEGLAGYLVVDCGEDYFCSDGACSAASGASDAGDASACDDSDGYNPYKKGSVEAGGENAREEFADECYGTGWVTERTCPPAQDAMVSLRVQCPAGFACSDGACTRQPESELEKSCQGPRDDGGIYSSNQVASELDGKSRLYQDFCANSSTYAKLWCQGADMRMTLGECPSGYACSEGACLLAGGNRTHALIFSWLYQPDGSRDFLVKSTMQQGYGMLEARGIYRGFGFSGMNVRLGGEDFYFSRGPGGDGELWANNGIGGLIDLGEKNLGDVQSAPKTGYGQSGIPMVLGHVYAVKTNDGLHYGLIKPYIMEERNFTNSGAYCRDTEYGDDYLHNDIYRKGYVTLGTWKAGSERADSCAGPNAVAEQICAGFSHSAPNNINCPPGYPCEGGACVKKAAQSHCYDEDGDDILRKGRVAQVNGSGTLTFTDECINAYKVREYTCDSEGKSAVSSVSPCESGYYCSEGACIRNNRTCVDSGSHGAGIRNTAYATDFGHSYAYSDYCIGNDNAFKYWCSGNEVESDSINCPAGTICENGACVGAVSCWDETLNGSVNHISDSERKIVIYREGDLSRNYTDFCVDEGTMHKYWCAGGSLSQTDMDCPAGKRCEGGICVNESMQRQPGMPNAPGWQSATMYIYPGWNMFSLPNSADNVTTTCSGFDESAIWMYDAPSRSYGHPESIGPGYGYWFYAMNKCQITSIGGPVGAERIALYEGWNLIGTASEPSSFQAISAACMISKGPYGYNSGSKAYEPANEMLLGMAYFVKAESGCSMGDAPQPPQSPTEG